jgi:hypothetical protein
VAESTGFDLGERKCPPEFLIGMEGIVQQATEVVIEGLLDKTSETHRVAALAVTRLARGGKTTFLAYLFDALKKLVLEDQKVNAMIVSFNGFGNFERVDGETQANAIIRNIVGRLVDPSVDQTQIRCTAAELDKHIGDSPFVLLVDELNRLGDPLDRNAARLLQNLFLKKKNRYLVFTSHYRMNIDPLASNGKVSESDPGLKSIFLPVSTDLATLRKMPGCGSINAATVALYGGIPSLIYSVFALNELKPEVRFEEAGLIAQFRNDGVDMTSLLSEFVEAVITGSKNPNLKMFNQFAITTDGIMQWPICYIKCILGLFEQTFITQYILTQCRSLETHTAETESGKDWECVIKIALGFRCLHQQFHGSQSPFDIVPLGQKPNAFAIELPDTIQSIEAAKDYMSKIVKGSYPALVLATPTFSNFPSVDGFVAYFETPKKVMICGYQAKLGEGLPKKNFSKKLDRGILLQGGAPDNDKSFKGWEHWNKEQVQELLGYSLRDLYPADWASFNSLASAEETVPGKKRYENQAR